MTEIDLFQAYQRQRRMMVVMDICYAILLIGYLVMLIGMAKNEDRLVACSNNRVKLVEFIKKMVSAEEGNKPDIEVQLLFNEPYKL